MNDDRINVRLPAKVKAEIEARAAREQRTVAAVVRMLLSAAVSGRRGGKAAR